MVQQQDTPGSLSDVPKRSFFRNIGKKQLYIILPLLLINAGIVHTLVGQVGFNAHADDISQVKDESAVTPAVDEVTSSSTEEDTIDDTANDTPVITTYTVQDGDTLGAIASKFNISTKTVLWANDLTSKSTIKPGQSLLILPVSGLEYTVKKGDTLSEIADKFDIHQDDILDYNDITADSIKVGVKLVLPGAEPITPPAPVKKPVTTTKSSTSSSPVTSKSTTTSSSNTSTKFIAPVKDGTITQGIHDGNAVDIAVPVGTPVYATADGMVLATACGSGYGNCIIINHTDGSQTLYAHLSRIEVRAGQSVDQGDQIGASGNTGRSTGPHLHYEERGTHMRNSMARFKVGTQI